MLIIHYISIKYENIFKFSALLIIRINNNLNTIQYEQK